MPDTATSKYSIFRWVNRALAILALCVAVFIFNELVARPSNAPWLNDPASYSEIRDGSFVRLLKDAGVRDPNNVVLKVYLGWSQDVSIALIDRPETGPQILIAEYDFQSRKGVSRAIRLKQSELKAFLSRFDGVAMGFRSTSFFIFDGRSIAFERRFAGRTMSYEGNASSSSRDAAMARVVDQLIANHGGYTWIRPDASGEHSTRTELGIPPARP